MMMIKKKKFFTNLINGLKQDKKIAILLFSIRTFYFDILAIRYLDLPEFRLWFILITMSFLALTLSRTGILEPYILRHISKSVVLKKYLLLTMTSSVIAFAITLNLFNLGIELSIQISLLLSIYLLMDLLRYFALNIKESILLRIELSLLLVSICSTQVTLVYNRLNLNELIFIQFLLCPLFYLFILPRLRMLKSNQEENQYRSLFIVRGMFATAILSVFLGLLNLVLLQSFFSVSVLVFYRSIASIVGVVRSFQRILWSMAVVESSSHTNKRMQIRKTIPLFVLFPVNALLFSKIYKVDAINEFLFCSSISILSQVMLIMFRYEVVSKLQEGKIFPFVITSLSGFSLSIPYLIFFQQNSKITVFLLLEALGVILSVFYLRRIDLFGYKRF